MTKTGFEVVHLSTPVGEPVGANRALVRTSTVPSRESNFANLRKPCNLKGCERLSNRPLMAVQMTGSVQIAQISCAYSNSSGFEIQTSFL